MEQITYQKLRLEKLALVVNNNWEKNKTGIAN